MARPRKDPDPALEHRRRQYRDSKRRHYERKRHELGKCKTPCALIAPVVIERVPVRRKNGDGFVWLPA